MAQFAQDLINAFTAGQNAQNQRMVMSARQQAMKEEKKQRQQQEEQTNDYQVAQREMAQGRPDVMQNFQQQSPEYFQKKQDEILARNENLLKYDAAAMKYHLGDVDPVLADVILRQHGPGKMNDVLSNPELRANAYSDRDKIIEQERIAKERTAKAGQQNINIGNDAVGLTTASRTATTKDVLDADKKLAMIGSIKTYIQEAGGHEALSSIPEGVGAAWTGIKSRLFSNSISPQEKKKYGARGSAIAALGTFSNQIISDLSGANVPEGEWERLMQSVPTKDDPGYIREAKISVWEKNYELIREMGYSSITEGLKKDPSLATKLVSIDQSVSTNPMQNISDEDLAKIAGQQ